MQEFFFSYTYYSFGSVFEAPIHCKISLYIITLFGSFLFLTSDSLKFICSCFSHFNQCGMHMLVGIQLQGFINDRVNFISVLFVVKEVTCFRTDFTVLQFEFGFCQNHAVNPIFGTIVIDDISWAEFIQCDKACS